MGQFLNSSQASKLFREGRTDLLSEFISKLGRQFSAYLIIDEFGDVKFDFPKRDSQELAAPPKPAAAKTIKAEKPAASLKENRKPQPKQKEFFNLIKAIGIVVLIFFGGIALLSALFDKKHTGQAIEYTIIYTTINGQFYEKEETAEDLNSEYVTFSDGTRVPWTAVKTKKSTFYPDELGVNTNSNR